MSDNDDSSLEHLADELAHIHEDFIRDLDSHSLPVAQESPMTTAAGPVHNDGASEDDCSTSGSIDRLQRELAAVDAVASATFEPGQTPTDDSTNEAQQAIACTPTDGSANKAQQDKASTSPEVSVELDSNDNVTQQLSLGINTTILVEIEAEDCPAGEIVQPESKGVDTDGNATETNVAADGIHNNTDEEVMQLDLCQLEEHYQDKFSRVTKETATLCETETDSSVVAVVSADVEDKWQENERKRPSTMSLNKWALVVALIVFIGAFVGGMIALGLRLRSVADPSDNPEVTDDRNGKPGVRDRGPGVRIKSPTAQPSSLLPTGESTKTQSPTQYPTQAPTIFPVHYRPGDLTVDKHGVLLSTGLDMRIIAVSDEKVVHHDGSKSKDSFHSRPDAAATFAVPENAAENKGGWVYVSNSEVQDNGGVGAITFNKDGEVIGYEKILEDTSMNCGGGVTPWGTWISCEEERITRDGQIYEVDPFGNGSVKTVLGGKDGGSFESFACDIRDREKPRFFVTEDNLEGALRRFTPSKATWEDPSAMLLDKFGTFEYLIMTESGKGSKEGTFTWTTNRKDGDKNALEYFPNSEGIDVNGNELFFVSKRTMRLFFLDLDAGTWKSSSTLKGKFDGGPDQLVRGLGNGDVLYFTEDGGVDAGIHGRDRDGRIFTILESPVYSEETTGLAFSPNGKHMYMAYQKNGLIFDIWRTDGLPFYGKTLNLKYHTTGE